MHAMRPNHHSHISPSLRWWSSVKHVSLFGDGAVQKVLHFAPWALCFLSYCVTEPLLHASPPYFVVLGIFHVLAHGFAMVLYFLSPFHTPFPLFSSSLLHLFFLLIFFHPRLFPLLLSTPSGRFPIQCGLTVEPVPSHAPAFCRRPGLRLDCQIFSRYSTLHAVVGIGLKKCYVSLF